MRRVIFLSFAAALALFIGCANTSAYRGGIGAYRDYAGFEDYLNRFSEEGEYKNNTFSSDLEKRMLEQSIPTPPQKANESTGKSLDLAMERFNLGSANDSESAQRATMRPYQINGKWYYPEQVSIGESYDGIASWYGPDFHSKKTSNGEIYDMNLHTAAHKTLPMNTLVRVTSKDSGKSTIVRINDRGPFVEGRIIDLSNAAARDIEMIEKGTARVNLEVVGFGGVLSSEVATSEPAVKNIVESATLGSEFKVGVVEKTLVGGVFAVQLGAFKNLSNAQKLKNLHSKHERYTANIKESEIRGVVLHRVFLTGFQSEDEARDFLKNNKIEGFLIRD